MVTGHPGHPDSHFQPIPTYTSLFQPIPANSSLFQHIPAHSRFFSIFQPILAKSSPFQLIQAYSTLFQLTNKYFQIFPIFLRRKKGTFENILDFPDYFQFLDFLTPFLLHFCFFSNDFLNYFELIFVFRISLKIV